MKKAKRLLSLLLLIAMLLPMLPTAALTASANTLDREDAMEAIKADNTLNSFIVEETQHFEDDGYIGIPYEITVYYDVATHGAATPDYVTLGGTPVMLYVVNANVERIGTESDESIIRSMLERGFVVVILDYLNDARAVTPDLDFSAQSLRAKVAAGDYFHDESVLPAGSYMDHLIVPAGYNVRYNDVFFELDKHGTDGTLDRIAHAWNNDFRLYKKDVMVKWVRPNGERKPTQTAHDGTEVVWYADAAGNTVDAANGQYTKVKWTKAEVVTDCVKPDGSPIDLNLYIHVLYPTSPAENVPVMTMFSSSGYLTNGSSVVARPQMQGFLFDGYAGVLFDYAWIPMGRNDHFGYFDGSSGTSSVTGDNQSYATYTYNASQVATAAMRYTRYLALSEPETYAFDIDSLGVFGISKAAWMTHLGAPLLRENLYTPADGTADEVEELVNDKINAFYQQLYLPGHHGETRYDNGLTDSYTLDGATIDGGERQPWAVWNGYEISSGAQMVYSSCGASVDYFCEGYSPQFITENLQDTYYTEYGKQNEMVNLCRNLNIPALWYEADIAHTFAEGLDYRYGVDIYMAFRKFAGYYLKGDAVSVTYTDPQDGAVISATDTITVKLIGEAHASELSKVTLTDANGAVVSGSWTGAYGDTEWTFLPDDALRGGETYTLTVPADFTGKNGEAMGEAYTATFYVRAEGEESVLGTNLSLNTSGTPVSLTVPAIDGADAFSLRVRVNNDAANRLSAYDAASGSLLGSVRVSGKGFYEIDLTDVIAEKNEGDALNLILRTENASDRVLTYEEDFNTGRGDFSTSNYTSYENAQSIDGETAVKITKKTNEGKFKGDYYFYEGSTVLTNKKLINAGASITRADMGRRFLIQVRLFDTTSRRVMLSMNSGTSRAAELLDFDRSIVTTGTEANAWNVLELPYTVYETEYGLTHQKQFYLHVGSTGDTELPIYVDHFTVYEIFTDVEVSSVTLAAHKDSSYPVKAPESENAFSVGGTEYATWKAAMQAAASGATVTMLRNYTLNDSDVINLGSKTALTVDLGGYRLTAANTTKAPLWIAATNKDAMTLTLRNGAVVLESKSLVTWSGATAAGSGKVVDITLEDVYLTHTDDFTLLSFFSEEWIENEAEVTANVTLFDCTLDIDRDELPNRDVVILGDGSGTLAINYTLVGGRLIIDDLHDVTLASAIVDTAANAVGDEFEIFTPVCEGTPVISYRTADSFAMPAQSGEENGYCIFVPADAKNSSEYGAIPDKYADAALYPFVVFANDVCIGAATNINAASVLANAYMAEKPGSTVALLLRRDYTCEKGTAMLDTFNGTLIIDLGGYTMTRNATVVEGMVTTSYTGGFDTSLIFKNGTVLLSNGHVIAFESKGTLEKSYDITFDAVTFAVTEGSSPAYLVTRCWGASGTADVNVKMTLNDCTFDFSGATDGSQVPTTALTVFHMANSSVHADVHVVGGRILSNGASPANVTWSELNAADDSLVFDRDANGDYITLTVPNGVTPSHSLPTADGTFPFTTLVSDGEHEDVYALTNDTVYTEYGAIPGAHSGNAFALFMDGKFLAACDTWRDANNRARVTLGNHPGATVTILLRADVTHGASDVAATDRVISMNGTVVVDLDGHALTADRTLFECGVPASYTGSFDTVYTVKNGRVLMGAGSVLVTELKTSVNKNLDFTFENVTFEKAASFADKRNKLFFSWGDTAGITGKVNIDLTLEDCTIDLSEMSIAFTIFSFGASTVTTPAHVTLRGGEILAASAENLNLCNGVTEKDTLTFAKNDEGDYTTLTLPTAATLKEIGGMNDEGLGVLFAGGTVSGESTVYTLTENDRVTKYGIIPESYASVTDYPFVIFKKDGSFDSAKTSWGAALNGARSFLNSNKGSMVFILMRTDFVNKAGSNRLGRFMGTVIADLGGHTLTRNSNSLVEAGTLDMTETESTYVANLTIKNGRILAESGHILTFEAKVDLDKTETITFENITFAASASAASNINTIVARSWGGSGTGVIHATMTFRNCTFDFSGSDGTSVPTSTNLVNIAAGATRQAVDVVFEGCELIGTAKGITLTNVGASDTVTYKKNASGKYFRFDVTTTNKPTTSAMTTEDGTMYFTRESFATVSGTRHYYYELGVKSADCDGAIVPYMYYFDRATYPYIIVQNGAFVGARVNWQGATSLAIAYLDNEGDEDAVVYLYLVRDVNETSSATYLSALRGKLIVDLSGYTLTATKTLFEGEARHAHTSTVQVLDGTIVINRSGSGSIIALNRGPAKGDGTLLEGGNKDLLLTFEDVTFRYAEGATSYNPLLVTWAQQDGEETLTTYLTFNGCTFDMRAATAAFNLFNVADSNEMIDVHTVINGGSILLPDASLVTWYKTAGEEDTLTLGAYGGAYPALTLASGEAPTTAFDTEEGFGYFYAIGGGSYAFGVGRAAFTGASVNLGADLSILYYVRLHDSTLAGKNLSVRFTMGDAAVTVSEYRLVNGAYVFALDGVAPQQMADTIDVVLLVDGEELASHTGYSIKQNLLSLLSKDASALGMSEEKTAALKALISDLLRYGAAAQDYTGYAPESPILDGSESLIESTATPDESDAMTLTGNTDPALYFTSAAVRFDTVNEIRIKLKVGDVDTSLVRVSVNGVEYKLTDLTALGGGAYLLSIPAIYANAFDTVYTVTLSYDGVAGATLSYSVNAYAYAMVNGATENAAMTNLALALYRYGVSADAYAAIA